MAFNINEFKTRGLQYGGARPALFSVAVTPPANIGLDQTSSQKFTFTASAATIPEGNIDTIQVPYFGRKIKIAGDRTFADWRVTVMNDEDFGVRSMMEMWSNALNRLVSNTRQPGLDVENYKALLNIIQYGKDGSVIREYQLSGAFPTSIDAIDLNWDTTNTIQTFNVTFAYDYWTPLVETSAFIAGGINQYSGNL